MYRCLKNDFLICKRENVEDVVLHFGCLQMRSVQAFRNLRPTHLRIQTQSFGYA